MDYYIYNGELYHYGVKGMKWGKRKQRDIIRNERTKVFKKEYERLKGEYEIDAKGKAAIAYGRKHNLDLDDGGGGSSKAGSKYMKMMEEIDALDTKALTEATRIAKKHVNGKFGETAVRDLEKHDNRVSTAKALAAVSTMMALPIGAIIYGATRG